MPTVYRLDSHKSTPRGDPPMADHPDAMPPLCAGCGGPLRYRGRRGSTTLWECPDPACPVVLADIHDPSAPTRRGGRA